MASICVEDCGSGATYWVEDVENKDWGEVYDEFCENLPCSDEGDYDIVDCEGYDGLPCPVDTTDAVELAKLIQEHGGETVAAFAACYGVDELEHIGKYSITTWNATPSRVGKDFSGVMNYAWEYFKDQYGEVPPWLCHIDWEFVGEELLHDYYVDDIHVDDDNNLYIFEKVD